MTIQLDGQARCDRCGVLDGNTENRLVSGWKRIGKDHVKHLCPTCSKEVRANTCLRCEGSWIPRGFKSPKRCPLCNSPYWDKPRQPPKQK